MTDTILGNTNTTKVLTYNTAESSYIDFIGDTDWWKIYIIYGFGYQFFLEGNSEEKGSLIDPFLAFYNGNGSFLLANDNYKSGSYSSYAYVNVTQTGYAFISAEESGNNAIGSYMITFLLDQLATTATAATVEVNSVSDTNFIGFADDASDWYGVSLIAGIQYQFDMIGSAIDGTKSGLTLTDPKLGLRSSSGIILATDDNSGIGLNSRLIFTPTTTGQYFLDAQVSGINDKGTYRIIANSSPTAGIITFGVPKNGTINFNGDFDSYSVTLTSGITYGFLVKGSTLLDPFLEILDSTGKTLTSNDNYGGGLDAYVTYTPSVSGVYYIAARSSSNNATGNYSAQVWQTPSVSIAEASATEGNTGTTDLIFTLTLSSAVPVTVSVVVSTSSTSTATSGLDFKDTSTTVTFAPGQTTATFTVPVLGDLLFEPTELFYVNLSSPSGADLGVSQAIGRIRDNDSPYTNLPTDSFLTYQWHLFDGTGANVFPVWSSYTGLGIRVAVFDWGVDATNKDLSANVLTNLGRNASNLTVGGSPILSGDNHGTAVAGVIAASANGYENVGVAYDAKIVSIYNTGATSEISNAFIYAQNFDILNNSWGYGGAAFNSSNNWAFYDDFSKSAFKPAADALKSLADNGRGGLGTIVVQSAGNAYGYGDDTNLHNFQNSRYIITVGATDYYGLSSSYSSPGASILVSAPGGDGTNSFTKILTTDRVGDYGYFTTDYAYVKGTSFSSPVVAGIVALMLQANPRLGYRDVQEILAYSARMTDLSNNTWMYNGAADWNGGGLHFDAVRHDLGYGLVDGLAAVRLAETWTNTSRTSANVYELGYLSSPHIAIPDYKSSTGVGSVFDSIQVKENMRIERIEVNLNITHTWVGDLVVALRSPSTLESSYLVTRAGAGALSAYGTSQDNIHFTLDTVLNWGEMSAGTWLLGVFDSAGGNVGTLDSWTIKFIGAPITSDNTYIYTNEFSEATADQAARSVLTDTGGIDTINAAACTANLVLNLVPGTVSTIDSRSLTIAIGTVIENAYGGDGNDSITGNSYDNVLCGMRGNDTIDGGSGTDTAKWTRASNNYQLSITNGIVSVTDKTGFDGKDTLKSIERLSFTDRTVILDSQAHASYAGLPTELYQFFITAFNAAPGVTYMDQLADAYRYGLSVKQIVDIFTTKSQFTNVYPTTLSHLEMATRLVNNIVKNSVPEATKIEGIGDLTAALDYGLSVGDVIYNVFGNLAKLPLTDPAWNAKWGNTSKQFINEITVAKYYTETLNQSTTDLETLKDVIQSVSSSTDVSTDAVVAQLIGVALLTGGLAS